MGRWPLFGPEDTGRHAVRLLNFHTRLPKFLKVILATLVILPSGLKQHIQIILMFGLSSFDEGIGQVGIKGMIWMTGSGMTSLAAWLCRYIGIQGTGR